MTTNVYCTARDEVRATRLIDEMRQAAFTLTQFSIFVPEHAVAGGFRPATMPQRQETKESPPAPGSFCELLYGLDDVVLATCGGLGRCLAAGELAPVLKAASAAGGVRLASELTRSGVPQAEVYKRSISEGKILVSVRCKGLEETTRVQSILVRAGAEDLVTTGATSSRNPGPESFRYPHAA
jgi:hypothetical protein